jgi:hypothetical protein
MERGTKMINDTCQACGLPFGAHWDSWDKNSEGTCTGFVSEEKNYDPFVYIRHKEPHEEEKQEC